MSDVSTWLALEDLWPWLGLSLPICFGGWVTGWFCELGHYFKQILRNTEKSFRETYPPIVHNSQCVIQNRILDLILGSEVLSENTVNRYLKLE